MRPKSRGSLSRLTPCTTPQPPRSDFERCSLERLSSVDPRTSVDRRTSSEVSFHLGNPPKRIRSLHRSPEEIYAKPSTANIRNLNSLGERNMMERFLENLPDIHVEESQIKDDEDITYF